MAPLMMTCLTLTTRECTSRIKDVAPTPLIPWDEELRDAFERHPETLGSLSIGKPNSGRLMNGVMPEESPVYHLVIRVTPGELRKRLKPFATRCQSSQSFILARP